MTDIDFAYFNYEHGGLRNTGYPGGGAGYDYAGLVRVMSDGDRWPHILIMGEGGRYEYDGGRGAREAAAAMRTAGGRAYVSLTGSLPRERGPFVPVIFVDVQSVVIRRWHDHRCPDFAARNCNLLIASLPGRGPDEVFRVVATHGDLSGGDAWLAGAQAFRRFADPAVPCLIAGDWNPVPSGPHWEDQDLSDDRIWVVQQHRQRVHRVLWQHGPAQAGPCEPGTRALDYLTGYRDDSNGGRAGGIGFSDIAELAGDCTPAQLPVPGGRQRRATGRMLVNQPWASAIIPGSYQVHQPADPGHPDCDHLRVSAAIRA